MSRCRRCASHLLPTLAGDGMHAENGAARRPRIGSSNSSHTEPRGATGRIWGNIIGKSGPRAVLRAP
eukprot:7950685-Alexandrium_andersonii.AAC.1